MPITYKIDLAHRCVFSSGAGEFSYNDARAHMDRLLEDPDFDPAFSQLIDFSEITKVALTHDEIYELSGRHVFAPDARRAFVTSTAEQFGLARMFQSYRAAKGETGIRVFRDRAEALAWLGLGDPPPPGHAKGG